MTDSSNSDIAVHYAESDDSLNIDELLTDEEDINDETVRAGQFVVVCEGEGKQGSKIYSIGEVVDDLGNEIMVNYMTQLNPFMKFIKTDETYCFDKKTVVKVLMPPKPSDFMYIVRVLFETKEVHVANEDIDFNDDKNILFDLPERSESDIENVNLESDYDSEDGLPLSHLLKKKKNLMKWKKGQNLPSDEVQDINTAAANDIDHSLIQLLSDLRGTNEAPARKRKTRIVMELGETVRANETDEGEAGEINEEESDEEGTGETYEEECYENISEMEGIEMGEYDVNSVSTSSDQFTPLTEMTLLL
ncbi:hypothetical protein FQA39_LY06462 [Lamprigera yunnana]|nr:hypothetical protein FQA39_LY06462 [Lamprigera yunnana]